MSDVSLALMTILVVLFLGTAAFGNLRNARGVFVVFMLGGAILPFVLALLGQDNPTWVVPLTSREGVKAFILCMLALGIVIYASLAVEKGYRPRGRIRVYPADARVANIFSVLSILFSGLYVSLMANQLGGLVEMIVRLYQRTSLDDSIANYLTIVYYASLVFAVFGFCFGRDVPSLSSRLLSYLAVAVCFGQTLMLGGRSLVVLFGVALFYVTLTRVSLARFAIAAVVGAVLIGATSYVMTNARFEAQNATVLTSRSDESVLSRATTGLTFVDHVAASIDYARDRGHDYGELYRNVLLLPIPRDLWPEKPLQISVRMRAFLFGDFAGGEPPGLFGEAYIAFGTAGVVAAAALLGLMIGWINQATTISTVTGCRAREAYVGLLAPLLPYAMVRSGFDIGTMRIGIPAFWCVVAILIARRVLYGAGRGTRPWRPAGALDGRRPIRSASAE